MFKKRKLQDVVITDKTVLGSRIKNEDILKKAFFLGLLHPDEFDVLTELVEDKSVKSIAERFYDRSVDEIIPVGKCLFKKRLVNIVSRS